VLLVGGVGYKLFIPVSTFYELPGEGAEVALHVHTHVREDVLALYGFSSATEERLFQRLIGVNGIGPALALKVMSGLEPSALVEAIRSSDLRRLGSIPGVGKKTAERLVVELRDKMAEIAPPSSQEESSKGPAGRVEALREDLLSALANLGFPRPSAEKSVENVLREEPEVTFEGALKRILRKLSA
jgi:Holliday junction DNA helicase RuvA